MTQQSPEPNERLSGTLLGSARNLLDSLHDLSAPFAIAGFIGLVIGIVFWALISDLRFFAYLLLGIGAGLLIISMTISFRSVGRAAASRSGRYGVNTAIMIAAFLAIAGLVNFLAFENVKRIDLTATKQFELAPRTQQLLDNLAEPVEARVFFPSLDGIRDEALRRQVAASRSQVEDMLHEFEAQTGSFSYQFIDPDREPEIAREYGLEDYGNTVFTSVDSQRDHQVPYSEFLEQDFVTALLIVTGEEKKQVYFLTGHGEKSIFNREEGSAEGFAIASANVERENYGVSSLNLSLNSDKETFQALIDGEIVGMLVVGGPRRDLLDDEIELLDMYLAGGGDMLLLLDPDSPQSFRDLAARWGVVVGTEQVIDPNNALEDDETTLLLNPGDYLTSVLPVMPDATLESILGTGSITLGLGPTIYPGIAQLEPAEGIVFVPDVFISPDPEVVVGQDTNIFGAALGIPSTGDGDFYYPAVAIRGFAALGEESPAVIDIDNPTSLVVFGDSDFASNTHFTTAFNSDIFLNSVNWLVGDAALASIRPKTDSYRHLILDDNQYNLMRYLGWFFLPSIMALAGAVVWWRRR